MQGKHGDGVDAAAGRGYLIDGLEDLGEHARQYDVPLIYEPLNRYETNQVNTVAAGVALLRSLSTKNVLLLADLFHMNIEETDLPAAIRAGKGSIGHVHFVDSNRRPPGMGHLDFGPIAAALVEIGYDRFASAEALPYPDPDARAENHRDVPAVFPKVTRDAEAHAPPPDHQRHPRQGRASCHDPDRRRQLSRFDQARAERGAGLPQSHAGRRILRRGAGGHPLGGADRRGPHDDVHQGRPHTLDADPAAWDEYRADPAAG